MAGFTASQTPRRPVSFVTASTSDGNRVEVRDAEPVVNVGIDRVRDSTVSHAVHLEASDVRAPLVGQLFRSIPSRRTVDLLERGGHGRVATLRLDRDGPRKGPREVGRENPD